jgi:SAM-dependent methyltransferase
MGEFSPEWLALREPADAAARSERLLQAVAARFAPEINLTVLDVGAGTGSNARYLAERLHPQQQWLLVDHDPSLLIEASQRMRAWGESRGLVVSRDEGAWRVEGEGLAVTFATKLGDLADLASLSELFLDRRLVTASALLDLCSAAWIESLASACRETAAAGLFALTYDGRIHCSPEEREDDEVRQLVNEHQRTDKGFGAALGPAASTVAAECFGALGYSVEREASDWHLEPDAAELQRQLIEGWSRAAVQMAPDRSASIREWTDRRLAHVLEGHSRLVVGHEDLAVWLPGGGT